MRLDQPRQRLVIGPMKPRQPRLAIGQGVARNDMTVAGRGDEIGMIGLAMEVDRMAHALAGLRPVCEMQVPSQL